MSSDHTKIPIQFDPLVQRMVGRTMHKGLEFDVPFMTEIAPNLWQGGCQDGLILPTHINYLVSLYPWERYKIQHKMRGELYVRMYDDPTQDTSEVDAIATQVYEWMKKGQVLVHCQAGLNRSSLIVARVLMMHGLTAKGAIKRIRMLRSEACLCNDGFEKYLEGIE